MLGCPKALSIQLYPRARARITYFANTPASPIQGVLVKNISVRKTKIALFLPIALAVLGLQGCRFDDSEYIQYGEPVKCDGYDLLELDDGKYIRKINDNDWACGDYDTVGMPDQVTKTDICESDSDTTACCTIDEIQRAKEAMKYSLCTASAHNCIPRVLADGSKSENSQMCSTCASGQINCGGECVDINESSNHCGSCNGANAVCDIETETCVERSCQKTQPCNVDTEIPCLDENDNIRCVSWLSADTCGAKECENKEEGTFCKCETINKGNQCKGDLVCNTNGECVCPEGLYLDKSNETQCNSPNDPKHCGANTDNSDGISCIDGQKCNGKECVCIEGIFCDGQCVNPLTNHEYCGVTNECGELVACNSDEICKQGVCTCADSTKAKCGNACIDVETDQFCGARGLCHSDAVESPDFKGYNCKAIYSLSQCVKNSSGQYSCTCDPGDVFDWISGDCVDPSSNDRACGTDSDNLIDCKLYYGEDATCKQGVCACRTSDWLKLDDSITWYSSLSNKRFRCVNPRTDNRFCGATTESRGEICRDGETCIDGKCQPTSNCEQMLCSEHCYYFRHAHLTSCDGGCDKGYCSLENDYLIEGCQGTIGLTCNCNEGDVLVDYGKFKKCTSVDKLNEMHIVITEGYTSKYICENGWADNQQSKHHKDGSLAIVDNTVCNINISSDSNNCGEIGKVCTESNPLNMTKPYCDNHICKYSGCANGYDDCNSDMQTDNTDGCETPITTDNNCGACGVTCNKDRICNNGVCCLADGKVTDNVKSYDCCDGLKKYKQCVLDMGFLGCWNHHYQCASSQPDGWEAY